MLALQTVNSAGGSLDAPRTGVESLRIHLGGKTCSPRVRPVKRTNLYSSKHSIAIYNPRRWKVILAQKAAPVLLLGLYFFLFYNIFHRIIARYGV